MTTGRKEIYCYFAKSYADAPGPLWSIGCGSSAASARDVARVARTCGLLVLVVGALASVWPFAAAEALGNLRRAEERDLMAERATRCGAFSADCCAPTAAAGPQSGSIHRGSSI
jgi:hypothetical protein